MITYTKFQLTSFEASTPKHYCEMEGLSTDDKPTENIANGSTFLEIDTSKVFKFNARAATMAGAVASVW